MCVEAVEAVEREGKHEGEHAHLPGEHGAAQRLHRPPGVGHRLRRLPAGGAGSPLEESYRLWSVVLSAVWG